MPDYLGYEVLEREPDGRIGKTDAWFREIQPVGPDFGRIDQDDHQGVSGTVREYLWSCVTRSDIAALKSFVAARKGRLVPFWLPSLNHDLRLTADQLAASKTLVVKTVGYATFLFPDSEVRRFVSVRPLGPSGTAIYRRVLTAQNNLDGTESLQLDIALGQNVTAAGWMVSFLRFCRLEEDVIRIEHAGDAYPNARIRVRELPHELDGLTLAGWGYNWGLGYGGI